MKEIAGEIHLDLRRLRLVEVLRDDEGPRTWKASFLVKDVLIENTYRLKRNDMGTKVFNDMEVTEMGGEMKEGDFVRFKERGIWQITRVHTYKIKGTFDHIGSETWTEVSIEWFAGPKERWYVWPFTRTKLVCTRSCLEVLNEMEVIAWAAK